MPATAEGNQWNILRSEVIKTLLEKLNSKELEHEVREELREEAELIVIAKCREKYRDLLATGPYTTQSDGGENDMFQDAEAKKKSNENDLIKERQRLSVLGAVMQQIDMYNFVVTIAVVDRFGELVAHKDFMHLIFRKRRERE
jgi:transcriptional accessory protein Tex/SPT6